MTIGVDLGDKWSEACVIDARGHTMVPHRVRRIAQSASKGDGGDAEVLARLERVDSQLLSPMAHRSEAAQRDRILVQARGGVWAVAPSLASTKDGRRRSRRPLRWRCCNGWWHAGRGDRRRACSSGRARSASPIRWIRGRARRRLL